jgi:hypothetical protein
MDLEKLALDIGVREWRLNNLYSIQDKQGKKIPFVLNWAQEDLLKNMHVLNTILKARQIGFSTFIQIYMLDACLFEQNINCGTIADSLDHAEEIFKDRCKFPYDNLNDAIKNIAPATQDSVRGLTFKSGSSIRVGTSLRSGTYQIVHVSEYGKICAAYPDRAREVRTGTFNAVALGQKIFVESTAEGQEGDFFQMCQTAQGITESGKHLTPLDFKFHFYPWHKHPEYILENVTITDGKTVKMPEKVHLDPSKRIPQAYLTQMDGLDMDERKALSKPPSQSNLAGQTEKQKKPELRVARREALKTETRARGEILKKATWIPEGDVHIPKGYAEYFEKLGIQSDIHLSEGQKAWYVKKAVTQGDDMKREFPSTPEEAFEAAIEGAYFVKEMNAMAEDGRIGRFDYDPSLPILTWWDIGVHDMTFILFVQVNSDGITIIDCIEESGYGLQHYKAMIEQQIPKKPDVDWFPHDMRAREFANEAKTRVQVAQELGFTVKIVEKHEEGDQIQAAREVLPYVSIDEKRCGRLLRCLRSFHREWNEKTGTWRQKWRHDWASHGASAFMGMALTCDRPDKPAQKKPKKPEIGSGATYEQIFGQPWEDAPTEDPQELRI